MRSLHRQNRLVCATLLALLTAGIGCAGDGVTVPPATATYDIIQREIFDVNCLSAGCHNPQFRAGDLDLSTASSYGDLVSVVPDNAVARDDGLLRVEPFDAENSFLLTKLTDPGAGEGSRMPQGQPPLSEAEIQLIEDWILNGAPAGTITPGASLPPPTTTPSPDPLS